MFDFFVLSVYYDMKTTILYCLDIGKIWVGCLLVVSPQRKCPTNINEWPFYQY